MTKGRELAHDWVGLWANSTQFVFGWDWQRTPSKGGNITGSTLTEGQWYYGVGTFDGTNRTLYLNGALDAGPSAGRYVGLSSSHTSIGNDRADANANSFDGVIDEVRISLGTARDLCWVGTEYNSMKYAGDTGYITPGGETRCSVRPQSR